MWIANDRGWSLLTHEASNGIRSWIVGSFASSASINHLIMLIWDTKHGTVNNLLGDDYGDSDFSAPAHHNWSCIWHAEVVMVTWVDRTGVIVIFFLQDLNLCCRSVTVTRTSLPPLLPSHLPVIRLFMNTCKLLSGSAHRRRRRIPDSRLATNCTYLAAKHTTILSTKTQYRTFYLNTFFAVLSR